MRNLAIVGIGSCLTLIIACAPRVVPAPVVTTPRYPDFVRPDVPAAVAASTAAQFHDRAWRFLQVGDVSGAEREIGLALAASPGFYPSETVLGYLALARTEPMAALEQFDRVLDRQSAYASALVGRGRALLALEREPEAIAAFELALVADPSLTDLRRRVEVLRFGVLEREVAVARRASGDGRLEEAARAYQNAIASSPDSAFLYRELGLVERVLGDVEGALESFRRAVELDPFDAASFAQMAAVFELREDHDEALRLYDESLAIERSAEVEARREALVARVELARLPDEYRAIETTAELTRADLAALIGVRLSGHLPLGGPENAVVITDVRGTWAEPWIMTVARADIVPPYDNHTYQPGSVVRRVDLAQAISRILPLLVPSNQVRAWRETSVSFADVPSGHLAYPAASLAVTSGVMQASDRSFQPSRVVTGPEAIAAIQGLLALSEGLVSRGAGPP